MLQHGVALILKHRSMINACLLSAMLLFAQHNSRQTVTRSCRRLERNYGWWEMVWNTYDDDCFKKTLRVSRETFNFVLAPFRHKLERENLCEEPIPPEFRLGLCLYRLSVGFVIVAPNVKLMKYHHLMHAAPRLRTELITKTHS